MIIKNLLVDCRDDSSAKSWVCQNEAKSDGTWNYVGFLAYGTLTKLVLTIITFGSTYAPSLRNSHHELEKCLLINLAIIQSKFLPASSYQLSMLARYSVDWWASGLAQYLPASSPW